MKKEKIHPHPRLWREKVSIVVAISLSLGFGVFATNTSNYLESPRLLEVATLSEATNSTTKVDIKSYTLRKELNTNHESTLYTGELVVTNYTDSPSDGMQYLILEANIEIPHGISSFSMSEIQITQVGTNYSLIESSFLKNYYYNPITAAQLSSGFVSGHIVAEVPVDVDIKNLSLQYGDQKIELSTVNQDSNNNSIVKDTNITISSAEIENYQQQQDEVDVRIQAAMDSGDYTLENPYILLDPYGRSPLTALVCFVTEEEGEVSVFVESKGEYGAVDYTVPSVTKQHYRLICRLSQYGNSVFSRFEKYS